MNRIKEKLILVTGGVRSGKSSFAESLAGKLGKKIAFIATAQALDREMEERIAQHRSARPLYWKTIEEPYQVQKIIRENSKRMDVILLDCLTLLVSNLMQDYREENFNQDLADKIMKAVDEIIRESLKCQGTVIVVSNEVGLGLVPVNPMGRFFRDILGKANQRVAAKSDLVYLLVAGIPMQIKGNRYENHH